ncbi:MAG: hypothetical protein MMC33_003161 [Icmadophila ericetorum]|nr:hypothetical protein [Icmadophila ericetorum]
MQFDFMWRASRRIIWAVSCLSSINQAYAIPDEPITQVTTNVSAPAAATTTSIDPDQVSTSVSLVTGSASATSVPHTSVPDCTPEAVGEYPPFCLPLNGTDKYPNEQYYVTWNAVCLSNSSVVTIELDYAVYTDGAGVNAWSSPITPCVLGYTILQTDPTWLKGQTRNNLTLTFIDYDQQLGPIRHTGPTISLIEPPVSGAPLVPSNPNLGVLIGVPLGVGLPVAMICLLIYGMRKHRHIDYQSIKELARKKNGYGIRKSRRQRVGKRESPYFADSDVGLPTKPYMDDPAGGIELPERNLGHHNNDSLGSLVNTPTKGGFDEDLRTPGSGNAFRKEISRQREERE